MQWLWDAKRMAGTCWELRHLSRWQMGQACRHSRLLCKCNYFVSGNRLGRKTLFLAGKKIMKVFCGRENRCQCVYSAGVRRGSGTASVPGSLWPRSLRSSHRGRPLGPQLDFMSLSQTWTMLHFCSLVTVSLRPGAARCASPACRPRSAPRPADGCPPQPSRAGELTALQTARKETVPAHQVSHRSHARTQP